ncbi:transcriptional regulator, LysR family [Alteromonadaceae bacterium Bs31]|nr:transcriptional regulator, LysR family [Alteromonadaceae bacterium Bs31]
MDINKLKLFVALAESKHFNRAAEQSHVSASKLTRVIQQLEQALGTQLFERDNRSVALTKKGKEFLDHSRELIQQWEMMYQAMQASTEGLTGSISIYCSVTASYSFLYEILRDFRGEHPGIEITLHTGDPAAAIERVTAGFEDVVIAAQPDKLPSSLAFKSITESPLIFIAPIEFVSEGVSAQPDSSWKKIPFILSERGIARERLNNWFSQLEFSPTIYAQVAGHEAIVSMVSLGFGMGLVPEIVLENSPLAKQVQIFPFQPDLQAYDVGICVQKKRLKNPLVNAFWEQV